MEFEAKHLAAFTASLSQRLPVWVGQSPRAWGQHVLQQEHAALNLPAVRLSREDLFRMAQSGEYDSLSFAVSVLAWGGMNRQHGRFLFANTTNWLPIVDQLRSGRIESSAAYEAFYNLRFDGRLPGMGPAFFTKLIFFSHPRHNGFIMDQWTARSVNLLSQHEVVATTLTNNRNGRIQHRVADQNTANTYAEFNDFILGLAKAIGYVGREDKVEEALFSTGRGTGAWRNYVIKHG